SVSAAPARGRAPVDWLSDVYLVCAVVGGTLLVVQTVLSALGGGHEGHDLAHDVDHDVAHDAADSPAPSGSSAGHPGASVGHEGQQGPFVKWLSLRTIVALLTFFGLAGLASHEAGVSDELGLVIALGAGGAAVFI